MNQATYQSVKDWALKRLGINVDDVPIMKDPTRLSKEEFIKTLQDKPAQLEGRKVDYNTMIEKLMENNEVSDAFANTDFYKYYTNMGLADRFGPILPYSKVLQFFKLRDIDPKDFEKFLRGY